VSFLNLARDRLSMEHNRDEEVTVVAITRGADPGSARVRAVVGAIEVMRAELDRPQPLSALARMGAFSPFHFHRLFREVAGLPPARFLLGLRMARARRLLLHSRLSVTEIGSSVGYASPGTFGTQFGRLTGLSPALFRRVVRALRNLRADAALAGLAHVLRLRRGDPAAAITLCSAPPPGSLLAGGVLALGRFERGRTEWSLATGGHTVPLPRAPGAGDYTAYCIVVPSGTRLVDALVDADDDAYLLGRAPLSVGPDRDAGTVRVVLHRPEIIDPPVLAFTPLDWLLELARRVGVAPRGSAPSTHRRSRPVPVRQVQERADVDRAVSVPTLGRESRPRRPV
jgi:AraC family transcriptional regulator